jgi:hypothetical protein
MQSATTKSGSKPCVDGLYRKGTKEFVGYCRYKKHKGFLTRKLMKQHQCLGKGCHYFQKFEDAPYWKEKSKIKQMKRDRKAEERVREERESLILETARDWTDRYGFMDFISAKEPSPGTLILTYFSKKYVDLLRCADYMERVWNCKVELRKIEPDDELTVHYLQQKKRRLA